MSEIARAPRLQPGGGLTAHRLRFLLGSRSGRIGLVLCTALVGLALVARLGWLPDDPLAQDPQARLLAPSAAHLLGTDQFGRDVFSRVAAGTGSSLLIAVVAVALAAVVGTLGGLVAGFLRGFADAVISGASNVLFAFPPLLLALTLASVLDRTWYTVAVAIAIVYAPIFVRVTRGPVLSLREIAYVRAATSIGQRRAIIMLRHVLPNLASIVIVQITLSLSWAVLTEASLSFLGLGTPPPAATLGSMIFEARTLVYSAPWTMIAPGVLVVALVVAFNLLGDGLRDAFDPRSEHR